MINRIKNRLKRDIKKIRKKIYLNENEKKILNLKDKHKGERCFILGMGPSLKLEDIEMLKDEVTFGCNKIFLIYDDTTWRPTYYSVADVLVAENNMEKINQVVSSQESISIFSKNVKSYYDIPEVIYVDELSCKHTGEYCFSDDLVKGYASGTTVAYRMIQQAIYMGCKKIYLLGMDYSFIIPDKKIESYHKDVGDQILVNDEEVNHFHKDYRKKGETWTVPKLDIQLKAFAKAKEYADKHDIKIINSSRQTKLEIFDKQNLDEVLGENK